VISTKGIVVVHLILYRSKDIKISWISDINLSCPSKPTVSRLANLSQIQIALSVETIDRNALDAHDPVTAP
jgi:hypothetical protein